MIARMWRGSAILERADDYVKHLQQSVVEYEDILKRNQVDLGLSNQEIERILDYFCMKSEHQKIYFLWRPRLPDP